MSMIPILTSGSAIPLTLASEEITEDFQYLYRGLLLGANTPYELQSLSGLANLPVVRSGSVDRFGDHGGVAGRHYQSMRTITASFDIWTEGQTEAEFVARRDAVSSAFSPIEDPEDVEPFIYKHPGRELMRVYCRPVDRDMPTDRMFSLGYGTFSVRLEATDPYIYSEAQYSVPVGVAANDVVGLQFPLQFPLNFGAGSSGAAQVMNRGTAPAPWSAMITGPTPSPQITHVESGQFIRLQNFTVQEGDFLVIDSKLRTILLNGTGSRRGYLDPASDWFALQPGNNTIRFSSGGATVGELSLTWRDTYWSD